MKKAKVAITSGTGTETSYATLCFVTNMATGLEKHLPATELVKTAKKTMPIVQQVLREAVFHLPEKRQCVCARSLKEARVQG